MRHFLLSSLVLMAIFSSSAAAQGLLEIFQQAKTTDPIWLGAQAGNRAAQEASKQSFAAFLPNASLSGNTTSNFRDS